jgi:hypothetical protein
VKNILRRLRRIERNLIPQRTPPDPREIEIVEQIQERLRRHYEAEGKPYQESPPLFPPDYNGPPLGIAETISAYRERQIQLEQAAPAQKTDLGTRSAPTVDGL